MQKNENAALNLAHKIKGLIEDKKGFDIVCYDISEVSTIADYFIIASANVDTHVRAVAENVIVELKKEEIAPIVHEGLDLCTWVCIDYGDVLVHIMREQERNFYRLESIWGACKEV